MLDYLKIGDRIACTLFCTGTIGDDEMSEIWVNTDVTTAKLETLWSTTRVACVTTACNCVVTFTTFCMLIVCYGKINLIRYQNVVQFMFTFLIAILS